MLTFIDSVIIASIRYFNQVMSLAPSTSDIPVSSPAHWQEAFDLLGAQADEMLMLPVVNEHGICGFGWFHDNGLFGEFKLV